MAQHQNETLSQSEYHLCNISMDIEAALMGWTQDGGTCLSTQNLTVPHPACYQAASTLPKGYWGLAPSCSPTSFFCFAKWIATEAQNHSRSHSWLSHWEVVQEVQWTPGVATFVRHCVMHHTQSRLQNIYVPSP